MGYPAEKIDIIQQIKEKRGARKNKFSINNKITPFEAKQKKPKYFAYIITVDRGFAPNPFYEFCTLATCKPEIRKQAEVGDWIIGFYSRAKRVQQKNIRGKLIYAMKVKEKITFDEYWNDSKFLKKKYLNKTSKRSCGDNIYHTDSEGEWIQEKNQFHEGKKALEADTKYNAVLISGRFFYFGEKAVSIPKPIKESINKSWQKKGHKILIDQSWRNHKYLDEKSGRRLIEWLEKKYTKNKLYGNPIEYKNIKNKCIPIDKDTKNKCIPKKICS